MRRRLFNLAAALSLLLTVAVCVLWVRSYWVTDIVCRECRDGDCVGTGVQLSSLVGTLIVNRYTFISEELGEPRVRWSYQVDTEVRLQQFGLPANTILNRFGFGCDGVLMDPLRISWRLWLPHWAIAILTSLPAALWLLANRQTARGLKRRGFAVEQVVSN